MKDTTMAYKSSNHNHTNHSSSSHNHKTTNNNNETKHQAQYLPSAQQRPSYLPHTSSNGSLRRDGGSKDFTPLFVLLDACVANNERTLRELVRRLSCLASFDVEPIVNFQDPTGRVSDPCLERKIYNTNYDTTQYMYILHTGTPLPHAQIHLFTWSFPHSFYLLT
jgi:hypothetical protein